MTTYDEGGVTQLQSSVIMRCRPLCGALMRVWLRKNFDVCECDRGERHSYHHPNTAVSRKISLVWILVIIWALAFRPVACLPAAGSSSVMSKLLTRRNLGLGAVGIAAVTSISYSNQQRLRNLALRAELPGPAPFTSGSTSSSSSTNRANTMATPISPATPLQAVNLRDIGEIDPRLRKGVLYRCSQIYTPDVLRELKIRTVVDLRGRAEKDKKKKKGSKSGKGSTDPPSLMPHEQVEALTGSGPSGSPDAAAAGSALGQQQQHGGPSTTAADSTASPTGDLLVTRLKHQASTASMSSVEEPSGSESDQETSNGNGKTVRRASGHEEMAVGLSEGEFALVPEIENFNVIPTYEFGRAMLRMPL